MADIWYDVDAALGEVPVNVLPLIDDTDFKTIEDNSVAYNAPGLELIWHFVTTAGAMSSTPVTPTTGGNYDWAHQDGGVYSIEIPASGGASINNDTEGFGWFTGKATGVLPWRSPVYGFRAAGLNNALIDGAHSTTRGLAGTALPDAAANAAGGLIISGAGGLDADDLKADVTAILEDTGTTLSGDLAKVPKSDGTVAFNATAGAGLADAILDRDMSTGTDSGSATVRTVRQALRFLRNKWSVATGTLTVTKEDDTTASWTSTVTTDAAANPVTGSDPASA